MLRVPRFTRSVTAATRLLPIERALKLDLVRTYDGTPTLIFQYYIIYVGVWKCLFWLDTFSTAGKASTR